MQCCRSTISRAIRTIINGDQVFTSQIQVTIRGQTFLIRIRTIGQIIFIQDHCFAGDRGFSGTATIRIDIGVINPSDPVVRAVYGRGLPVFRIRNALSIRIGAEHDLIDRHAFWQVQRIAALIVADIGGEVAFCDQLTVIIGGPMAFLDPFTLIEFVIIQVGDGEADTGDRAVKIYNQLFRGHFGRIIPQLTRDTGFRRCLNTKAWARC